MNDEAVAQNPKLTEASYFAPALIQQFGQERIEVLRTILLSIIFFATLVLTVTSSHGQTKARRAEIRSLVRQLSWDSVGGKCNGVWRIFPIGDPAARLVQIGKPATRQLVQVLDDQESGVAAHLILTAIWDGERVSWENWVEDNQGEVAYFNHVYNGLRWTDIINSKEPSVSYKVDAVDLKTNYQKWKQKLARRNNRRVAQMHLRVFD